MMASGILMLILRMQKSVMPFTTVAATVFAGTVPFVVSETVEAQSLVSGHSGALSNGEFLELLTLSDGVSGSSTVAAMDLPFDRCV